MDFILTGSSIKRLVYLFLVTCSALLIAAYLPNNTENNWLVWSAFIISLIPMGDDFRFSAILILFTGLSAALLSCFGTWLGQWMPIVAVYLLIITLICMYITQQMPQYALSAFIINLFVLLSVSLPLSPSENVDRLILILMGAGLATLAHSVEWPFFKRNKLQFLIVLSLRDLKQLNVEVFSCFLQPEYSDNLYLFERRVHLQKEKFLKSIKHCSTFIHAMEKKIEHPLLTDWLVKLNGLYNTMQSVAELRWRVKDHSTFAVCEPELLAILSEINQCFAEAIAIMAHKRYRLQSSQLKEKITKFEDNYHHVLQVASREPLVFLLFISSLRAFNDEILSLREAALKIRARFLWPS